MFILKLGLIYVSHVSDPVEGGSTGLPATAGAREATFRTSPLPTELDNWLDYVNVQYYNTTFLHRHLYFGRLIGTGP